MQFGNIWILFSCCACVNIYVARVSDSSFHSLNLLFGIFFGFVVQVLEILISSRIEIR